MDASSHHQLNKLQLQLQLQQQQQSEPSFRNLVATDGQIPAPIPFLNNATNYDDPPRPSQFPAMGLALADLGVESDGWEPRRKRLKEWDFLDCSQVTSLDLMHPGSVSTGLGLSLDDGRVAASSSGESPFPFLPVAESDFGREMERLEAEMDSCIRIEGERLRQSILENFQSKQLQALSSLEGKILGKIQEKEAELESVNKKNMELEELAGQLNMEVSTWQQRAKYNEDMIGALKDNVRQMYARGRAKEGCGDSEVDDTASFCNGGGIDFQLLCKAKEGIKESMACKICRVKEACMLVLPCRHLSMCKECESKLSFCPVCQKPKFIVMEIYM